MQAFYPAFCPSLHEDKPLLNMMSMPCIIVHTYHYSSWEAEAVVFRFPQDTERACLDHTTA